MTDRERDDSVPERSLSDAFMPPLDRGQPSPAEIGASNDAVVRDARERSTVLSALQCQRRGCGKTLAWLVVLHDRRTDGGLRLELAAPVEDAPVDDDDEPGAWVAFVLQGNVQTRAARSRYVGGLGGNGVIRITCRCGRRNWLRAPVLRSLGEALRL